MNFEIGQRFKLTRDYGCLKKGNEIEMISEETFKQMRPGLGAGADLLFKDKDTMQGWRDTHGELKRRLNNGSIVPVSEIKVGDVYYVKPNNNEWPQIHGKITIISLEQFKAPRPRYPDGLVFFREERSKHDWHTPTKRFNQLMGMGIITTQVDCNAIDQEILIQAAQKLQNKLDPYQTHNEWLRDRNLDGDLIGGLQEVKGIGISARVELTTEYDDFYGDDVCADVDSQQTYWNK